jgi:hypothetical protein
LLWRFFSLFPADLGQLAGIQPVTATVGTFVHFHPAFGAEKVFP